MPNKYLDSVGLAEYTSLVKADLATKAPLASPALTGTPTAPTPTVGDDSTKIATTEFVQDAIDAEETRADGAYLPFTGGSITGNLSVSGTITGDVTGDLTGNADTATNATNDGNGDEIATTYLPLSGGTLTGKILANVADFGIGITHSGNDGTLTIRSADVSYKNGAQIVLSGINSTRAGSFIMQAADGTNTPALEGKANGTLTWNGNDITPQKVTSITTSSDVNVANNTVTNLLSFTLSKGTWLVTAVCGFANNSTGMRKLGIATSATSATMNRFAVISQSAIDSEPTNMQLTLTLDVSSSSTYYVNVVQKSGGSLNCGGGVKMFRLSSKN